MACGEELPDAPFPAGPAVPFLRIEGGGGRSVTGMDWKLRYLSGASSESVVAELDKLQSVVLIHRSFLEALVLVLAAVPLALVAPGARPVAALLLGLGLLGTFLGRRYSLVLKLREGGSLLWPLGLLWLGSRRLRELESAWSSAAQALASRGVTVQDASRAPGPGA